jgi:hypothetical protein
MRFETLWGKISQTSRNSDRGRVFARLVAATAVAFGGLGIFTPQSCLAQG